MSMLKHFCSPLPLIPLLLLPLLAHGEEEARWYQVEIIIFSQNSPDYHQSEIWPLDYKLPDLESSRELLKYKKTAKTTTPQLPEPFSLAAEDSLQLGETASRIKRAKDVELILHLAWVQPGLEEKQAVPVHIHEGMMERIAQGKTTKKPLAAEETALPKLDGTLRLTLSRYLHLESDLVWREPLPPGMADFSQPSPLQEQNVAIKATQEATTNTVPAEEALETTAEVAGPSYQVFRMQQSSRMRSSEIHYQDHPLFGIIAVVNRYEQPQAAQPETPTK